MRAAGMPQRSAHQGVESARCDDGFWRHAGDGDHEDDERADGDAEDSVVCGADPTQQEYERADEDDFETDAGWEEVKHRGSQEQAEHRAGDAQQSASECDGEFRL